MAGTVLVAEDDRVFAEIIRFNLERAGFDVVVAFDGQAAVDLAQTTTFELIISDYQMPRLSGEEVCRAVRESETNRTTPIVFCTAKGFEVDQERLTRELGVSKFFPQALQPDGTHRNRSGIPVCHGIRQVTSGGADHDAMPQPAPQSVAKQIRRVCLLAGITGSACLLGTLVVPVHAILPYAVFGAISSIAVPFFLLTRMHRRLGALSAIEDQLSRVTDHRTATPDLDTVATVDAATHGWNELVAAIRQQRALQHLEESVSRGLARGGSASATAVLDAMGEGVAVTDVDGRLTMVNEALTSIIRCGDDEPRGQRMLDLLERLVGDQNQAFHDQFSTASRPAATNLECTENGSRYVLRCDRRPQRNDDRELTGYVWTVRNVTQQCLAEEMREQFVSTASHELRTPLANIRAYAETLSVADGLDVQKQKEFCNTIHSEAARLGRFVDDLLDVTRMQVGSMTLNRHETDIARLIDDVCAKIAGQVAQNHITFNTEFPPKIPEVAVDKDKLSAALVNLLGNALKYSPEGGEINFRVERAQNQLSFSVEDSGIGIAAEELPHIFDKFFRSDDDRVQSLTGTGLGLAFTKEVARLHGGDVTVHSELDKGTRFTLTIPVRREDA